MNILTWTFICNFHSELWGLWGDHFWMFAQWTFLDQSSKNVTVPTGWLPIVCHHVDLNISAILTTLQQKLFSVKCVVCCVLHPPRPRPSYDIINLPSQRFSLQVKCNNYNTGTFSERDFFSKIRAKVIKHLNLQRLKYVKQDDSNKPVVGFIPFFFIDIVTI